MKREQQMNKDLQKKKKTPKKPTGDEEKRLVVIPRETCTHFPLFGMFVAVYTVIHISK